MITVGDRLPDFRAPLDDGSTLHSGDLTGGWTLLYWFPRADTPGCTAQAQGLRDQAAAFDELCCRILGASSDSVEALAAFRRKYRLPFPLLSDPDRAIAERFGVCSPSGDTTERVSILADPDLMVRRVYRVEDPTLHAEDVLDDLEQLLDR